MSAVNATRKSNREDDRIIYRRFELKGERLQEVELYYSDYYCAVLLSLNCVIHYPSYKTYLLGKQEKGDFDLLNIIFSFFLLFFFIFFFKFSGVRTDEKLHIYFHVFIGLTFSPIEPVWQPIYVLQKSILAK